MSTKKVEIYIGYTDRTWDTAFIDMPKNIPDEEIESFIIQEAIDLWANTPSVHVEVAFAGLYNDCPDEEEENG